MTSDVLRRRAVTQTELPPDPLGYDTSDLATCALEMAAAAQSGRNREAVAKEIEQVERRFGLTANDRAILIEPATRSTST